MSKQTDLMELEKCIVSRLWYVATIVHQRELTDRCRHRRDVKKLKDLIASCAERGLDEHKWIAYNLSSQIENDEAARKSLSHEEFVCILKLLDTRIPHDARDELLRLFEAVQAARQNTDVPTCRLSQESLECLEINIIKYPPLINWLIDGLLCIWLPASFAQTDMILQEIYFSSIKKLLVALSREALEASVKNTITSGFCENIDSHENFDLGALLSILSKLNLTEGREDEMLAWLCPALLDTVNSDDIELALYSRKNDKFFRAWHEFLDYTYARFCEPCDLESALKVSRIMFSLKENSVVSLNANEIFKRMLRRQTHWLADIFDICYVLLINERHREVEKILTTPVLKDFWLPLLFRLLKDCSSSAIHPIAEKTENSRAICDALRFVLEKLSTTTRDDSALRSLTSTLDNHLKVLYWILDNKRDFVTSDNLIVASSVLDCQNFSVKNLLNLLQSNGVLAVLKITTNIHALHRQDIRALLNHDESARNTFQGYRTMLDALEGIIACEFYNEKYERVAVHFDDMEKSLGSLFPLDLRLRVIENIFTMLFLRCEDFNEFNDGSDIGEDDLSLNARDVSTTTTKNFVETEIGFFCNKYAIREILARLGRSVIGAEHERAEQWKDAALTFELNDNLEKSTNRISEAINDATLRLELLTSLDFIERHGLPDVNDEKMKIFANDEFYVDDRLGISSNATNSKIMFYRPNVSSSDENEFVKSDDLDGSSKAGSQGNTSTSNKRRKRSKNQSSPLNEGSKIILRDSKRRESTLNRMLASKESLVLQCAWKNDYDRATMLIEMFGLKNSRLDGEILFSRAMRMFRKEIRAQWSNSDSVDSPDGISEQSTLDNIRKAVQDGFQTSRTTSQIETFLASQESSVRLLNYDSMSPKEILTIASLDLALTVPRNRQDSINLSDVTMKYLRMCKKFSNTRYHDFFQSIYRLLYDDSGKNDLSIKDILCDSGISLSAKEARERSDYWSRLRKKIDEFRRSSIRREDTNFRDNANDATRTFDLWEKNFQDVISLCENGESYLPRIHAHIKLLRSIAPENLANFDANERLLETSLDAYIGDQIFRLSVELEKIETIASRLNVNLVHVILANCCPKLSFRDEISSCFIGTRGVVILNDIHEENISRDAGTFHEPNECVREILSELVEALEKEILPHGIALGRSEARKISKKRKIRDILAKTRRIADLDLSNLSFGHHTLVFFLNIWNLMMIHATLNIWSNYSSIDDHLRHEISLTCVAYDIGDLGIVSLASLRAKLVGRSNLWGKRYFSHSEELNEAAWQDLDVPYEPRVIFAMINEYDASPIVRIYGPDTLDIDLRASMTNYIDYHGKSNNQRKLEKIAITELVRLYDDLIAKRSNSMNDAKNENITNNDCSSTRISPVYSYSINFTYSDESSRNNREKVAKTCNDIPWRSRIVETPLLRYLETHCWLLSYLVRRMHNEIDPTISPDNCANLDRIATLENLFKSAWIKRLKYLCDDNETFAGLRKIIPSKEIWNILEALVVGDDGPRCLEIIDSLPDSLISNNIELQRLRDKILAKLTLDSRDRKISETMTYVYRIRDVHVLAQLILVNANDLPIKVCQESLIHVLGHRDREKLPLHCKSRMNEILCRVTVFKKMLPYCTSKKNDEEEEEEEEADNWHNVIYHIEKTNPSRIVKSLIDANQHELCLEWLEYQAVVSSEIHSLITHDLLVGLLAMSVDNDFKHPLKLLRALPRKKSLNLCRGVIGKLDSIRALRFVVEYLVDNTSCGENFKYRRDLLGIDIIERLEPKERPVYVHLIEQPLLMLEQLLMNCRLDSLQRIVVDAREKSEKFHIYTDNFDETVRFYAKKSLDLRVAVQIETIDRIKDTSITCNKSQNGDFVMPINIPTKEEWVPNDKARSCSCCGVVIFSMFNRRHHCRRCGRVVCGACSPQRMRLPSYPNSVPVRVCNDCKRQSLVQLQTAPSTPSSETFDCWRLSVDETHNKTLRDEFSFENAPSISLCLAILNLHSDHEAYSNFLLDRCDEMKSLLRPDGKGRVNPEIDHALVIKMIRSLLVAAKVKCAELGLNTGLAHCDRFLSQVDLTATLVNSDCSYLIPRIDKDDHLDDHTLRRLRDMLTEKEKWTLALDVSTKTGLDTQGVWAAWGTACLRVGYYERAREKFARCLEKVSREDSDDWVILTYPDESENERSRKLGETSSLTKDTKRRGSSAKQQEGLKNRPSKDPPLLMEILQILDRPSPNDSLVHQNTSTKCTGAREILNTLGSLKAISQGNWTIGQSSLSSSSSSSVGKKNHRYHESLYYLLMYGSFNSILGFFIKNGEYEKCLAYIIENDVETELFVNDIFLVCLRNGAMMNLCESMRLRDPSLVEFKKYLMHTCHSLERKKFLHTLQQLQLFMKDYVRASMTCIRFYITDATSYRDLCTRTRLLVEAQKHLETELRHGSYGRKRRRSVGSSASGQNSSLTLEMDPIAIDRHVNTISRQMEIAKFLGNCEQEGRSVDEFLNKLSCMDSEGASNVRNVPTLFGNQQEKTHLAVLAILCGRDVEEGFGIAFRIMQDYNLRPQKIYSLVGHMLALDRKISSIEQLIKCCRSSGAPNSSDISDRVLAHCVKLLLDRSRTDSDPSPKDQIDALIRIITDVELKIASYIESRQLKAAYLLAVKHSRAQDIRKILKEADRLGQSAIKSICTKWLQQTQKLRGDL